MTLHDYIKLLDKPALERFASRCGTSVGQLKQVGYGNRRPSASLAICIERESARSVICEDMRPDIDWAYLRSTESTKSAA